MEAASVQVTTVRSATLPDLDEVIIAPIGDVQLDPVLRGQPRSCDVDRFKRHIDWLMKQKNAYFMGFGDYVDVASPSNRANLKAVTLYDNVRAALDEQAYMAVDEMKGILKGTEGRWLGLLEGHHYWEFEDGTTTDTKLAEFLKAPHLGSSALVEVKFEARGKHGSPKFVIYGTHGSGAGGAAGMLNKLRRLATTFSQADVLLMGHYHIKPADKIHDLYVDFGPKKARLKHRNRIIAGTGGWLKGYMLNSRRGNTPRGSYVEQGTMPPVTLGAPILRARPRYDHDGYSDVDLEISL